MESESLSFPLTVNEQYAMAIVAKEFTKFPMGRFGEGNSLPLLSSEVRALEKLVDIIRENPEDPIQFEDEPDRVVEKYKTNMEELMMAAVSATGSGGRADIFEKNLPHHGVYYPLREIFSTLGMEAKNPSVSGNAKSVFAAMVGLIFAGLRAEVSPDRVKVWLGTETSRVEFEHEATSKDKELLAWLQTTSMIHGALDAHKFFGK
jgi:hypothetical protein